LIAGLVMSGGVAMAQDAPKAQEPTQEPPKVAPPVPEAPKDRELTLTVRATGEFGFETELSGAPGKVTATRAGGQVEAEIPVAQYAQLELGLDYEHSSFDFHSATGFVAGASSPFHDVDRAALSARFIQPLSKTWAVFAGGVLIYSGEEGAKGGDSLGGVIYGAPRYVVNDHLAIGLGALVQTRLEDNVQVVPLVLVEWDITEHWNLTHDGFPGGTLTYKPNDHWAFALSAYYQFQDFRLDESGPLPNGVGRETRVPVVLSATWTPDKRIYAEAGIGVAFAQNYELLNASGDSVADIDAKASPLVRFKLAFKF
jgi:hypothetical protein